MPPASSKPTRPPQPAAEGDQAAAERNGQDYIPATGNREEDDLAASLRAQGKSGTEIQNALDNLRSQRAVEFRQASQVKPNDPFPTNTTPTGTIGGKPFGEAETVRPNTTEHEDKRGVRAQNDALSRLADAGYRVVQQPTETKGPNGNPILTSDMQKQLGLKPDKKPDALIEGRVFDVYSPATDKTKAVYDEISGKVGKDQAHRIVLNLHESDVSGRDLRQLLQANPIQNLKEILIIDKKGIISHFFPFQR